MCSACCLIVFYICVKFGENISDGIRVRERTQMMERLTDGEMDRRTDTLNFGWYNIIPSPLTLTLFVVGHKNIFLYEKKQFYSLKVYF